MQSEDINSTLDSPAQRRLVLAIASPLLALVCWSAIPAIAAQQPSLRWEMILFFCSGAAFFSIAAVLHFQPRRIEWGSRLCVLLVAVLIGERILRLFLTGHFDNPAHGFFLPVFSYMPGFYLLSFLALPLHTGRRFALAVWLIMALVVTALSLPYWAAGERGASLLGLLSFIWCGHGLFLFLFAAGERQKIRALQNLARLASSERAAREATADSEARFRGIFDQAAVGIALLDERGAWLNVNQTLCDITGYDADALKRIDFQSITHPDDLALDVAQARSVMAGEIDRYSMEKRYIHKDGHAVWILLSVRRIDAANGMPARFVSVIEDISERKAVEERVHNLTASLESKVALRTAQLQDSLGLWQARNAELALVTEMGGLLSAAQDREEAGRVVVHYLPLLFPLASGALHVESDEPGRYELSSQWGASAEYAASFAASECWAVRRGQEHRVESASDPLHCKHCRRDAAQPQACVPLTALGHCVGVIELAWGRTPDGWAPDPTLLRTIAEQIGLGFGNVMLREELRRQVMRDPLTGMNNRRALQDYMLRCDAQRGREEGGYAVLAIDLDHFKSINDRFGHDAGDIVLREVGELLRNSVRADEAAFRLGGEEFIMVLRTVDLGAALRAADRVRREMAKLRPTQRDLILPSVTCSIGVALCPADGPGHTEVLRAADQALYEAKRSGRNRVVAYSAREAVAAVV